MFDQNVKATSNIYVSSFSQFLAILKGLDHDDWILSPSSTFSSMHFKFLHLFPCYSPISSILLKWKLPRTANARATWRMSCFLPKNAPKVSGCQALMLAFPVFPLVVIALCEKWAPCASKHRKLWGDGAHHPQPRVSPRLALAKWNETQKISFTNSHWHWWVISIM
jgi:hypothetical protein